MLSYRGGNPCTAMLQLGSWAAVQPTQRACGWLPKGWRGHANLAGLHGSQQSYRVNIINGGINHREGWRAGVAVALCLALCELVGCVATVEHLLCGPACIDRTDLIISTLQQL